MAPLGRRHSQALGSLGLGLKRAPLVASHTWLRLMLSV